MTTPSSPEDYDSYERITLPRWSVLLSSALSVFAAFSLVYYFDFIFFYNRLEVYTPAILAAMVVTVVLHEVIHYLAYHAMGYDPEFLWPPAVAAFDQPMGRRDAITTLVAPQVLTVSHFCLLLWGFGAGVEVYLTAGFILSLGLGHIDLSWATRIVRWPEGTVVLVDSEKRNYVAFPT